MHSLIRNLTFVFILFKISCSQAQTWGSPVQIEGFNEIRGKISEPSLAIVNGNPAMSYFDGSHGNLMFVRAIDAAGTSFAPVIVVDQAGTVGAYSSLLVVNGYPAIAYYDQLYGNLKYVRATNISGTAWGTPIVLDEAGQVGWHTSLRIINGKPAISYLDVSNGDLKYIRATDISGTAWNAPITVDATGTVGLYSSMQVIDGKPAIAYHDQTNLNLKYVRANDADGITWNTPLTIDAPGNVGLHCSLQMVNGNPAISYCDHTNGNLKYVRATNISGTTWASSIVVDAPGTVGQYTSLQIVKGFPAIAYFDYGTLNLKYVCATDISGVTWNTPRILDPMVNSAPIRMLVVDGKPTVTYGRNESGDWKICFKHASDSTGNTWLPSVFIRSTSNTGAKPSAEIVNGNPAVSFVSNEYYVNYVRASDPQGAIWGSSVRIDSLPLYGNVTSLKIVGGNPAMTYYDLTSGNLKYVRALDADGNNWPTPIVILAVGVNGNCAPNMEIVNGNPAIAYFEPTNSRLCYIRALDALGTNWSTPVVVDPQVSLYPSMKVIDGMPAIAYYLGATGDLKYVRATDASGAAWGSPLTVDAINNTGFSPSLETVSGNPAISYYDNTLLDLKYIRATDVSGTTWGSPQTIDASGRVGEYNSMAIINGTPAVSYYAYTNKNLKYISATDAIGSSWNTPFILDSVSDTGLSPMLIAMGTGAGIAYFNYTEGFPYFISGVDLPCSDPVIMSNPLNAAICPGGSTSFAIIASNANGYQWQLNSGSGFNDISSGPNYPNVSFPSLSITNALSGMNNYQYRCKVINNGCINYSNNAILHMSAISSSGPLVTNANCNGVCNGSVSVTPANGIEPYSYIWSGIADSTATVSNMCSGNYTVSISDSAGCTLLHSFTVSEPSSILVSATNNNVSCFNGNNGSISLSTSGGVPSYSYSWNPPVGTSAIASGLTAGTYSVTIQDAGNCLVEKSYTISEPSNLTSTVSASACGSYILNGTEYTASGLHTQNLIATNGCDSTITLNLIISQPTSKTINASACNAYELNGQSYTSSGSYTQLLTNVEGCDSTIILNLIIKQPTSNTINASVCNAYELNGQSYTSSGTYTQLLTNVDGCDSTITLNLIIKQPTSNTINASVCNAYELNGQSYTSSGTYTQLITNVEGCDSTITLNLIIKQPTSNTINASVCNTYELNGQSYTSSGTYTQLITNVEGCDSTITLNLTFLNPDVSLTQHGDTLIAIATAVTYQWIDCSNGSAVGGAISQEFIPSMNGSYAVIITNNSCSDTSTCALVFTINLYDKSMNEKEALVFPNPFTNKIIIELNGAIRYTSISIFNSIGQQLIYQQMNENQLTLDLLALESGLYFLRISDETSSVIKRIIKE